MALISTVSPENAEGSIKEAYEMFMKNIGMIPKPMEMMSARTIRLSEEEYILFSKAAEAMKRPISNLINYLARQKLEEDLFVDQIEMDEILENKNLVEFLKKGSGDAKLGKVTFVDV